MMKKAFTLSEALVTLAIIAVLLAILIPVIDNVRPDKDKVYYKKALYDMQNAVANAMDSTVYSVAANSAAYWADDNVGETISYVAQGIMRKEDAVERLRFEKINNQICFNTEKALSYLKYIGFEDCR